MSKYGVYEDRMGVLWSVRPATKENAVKEAGLVGEGHRVVKVKKGRELEAAFEAGQKVLAAEVRRLQGCLEAVSELVRDPAESGEDVEAWRVVEAVRGE